MLFYPKYTDNFRLTWAYSRGHEWQNTFHYWKWILFLMNCSHHIICMKGNKYHWLHLLWQMKRWFNQTSLYRWTALILQGITYWPLSFCFQTYQHKYNASVAGTSVPSIFASPPISQNPTFLLVPGVLMICLRMDIPSMIRVQSFESSGKSFNRWKTFLNKTGFSIHMGYPISQTWGLRKFQQWSENKENENLFPHPSHGKICIQYSSGLYCESLRSYFSIPHLTDRRFLSLVLLSRVSVPH